MMGGMQSRVDAWIGLGANVGAPRASLELAVAALAALPGARLVGVSPLYRTQPVGPVEQSDFLNAVIRLRLPIGASPEAAAMDLLVALKGLERSLGRIERQRWGPREIDLDLLLFGNHVLRVERDADARSADPARGGGPQWLEVPHPSARQRLFVLAPLADLAPALEPPGWGESVVQARDRERQTAAPDALRLVGTWDASRGSWSDAPS
jgi:2-amino-4-hydroxy-6-hydroxymethyldihydropteridine diphosphokinase